MIIDKLENLHKYVSEKNYEHIAGAISTYKKYPKGEYKITEEIVIKKVISKTKLEKDCKIESHRIYADIQIPLEEEEIYKAYDIEKISNHTEYDSDKDVTFYQCKEKCKCKISVQPGEFIYFSTGELHQPQIANGEIKPIEKIVVKVRENYEKH